jgi:hypothetical protein
MSRILFAPVLLLDQQIADVGNQKTTRRPTVPFQNRSFSMACKAGNRNGDFLDAYAWDVPLFETARLSDSRRWRLLAFLAMAFRP